MRRGLAKRLNLILHSVTVYLQYVIEIDTTEKKKVNSCIREEKIYKEKQKTKVKDVMKCMDNVQRFLLEETFTIHPPQSFVPSPSIRSAIVIVIV